MKDPYILEDGTLKNLLGITDYGELNKAEKDICFIKLVNLDEAVPHVFDSNMFKKLHKHIFEDIFSWAGEFRTVPIYKEEIVIPGLSLEYSECKNIESELNEVFSKFNSTDWKALDLDNKSKKFTELLSKLWMIHPFRDRNTRTTMAFASIFAKEHDFPMDLGIILDNLTRKYDENGRTKRFSIRDKFVLASLDEKFAPEPEHLQALLKQSMVSGIKKKIDVLSNQLQNEEER